MVRVQTVGYGRDGVLNGEGEAFGSFDLQQVLVSKCTSTPQVQDLYPLVTKGGRGEYK